MVGSRQEAASRNPMRRTASLTEFAPPDVLTSVVEDEEVVVSQQPASGGGGGQDWLAAFGGAAKQEEWLTAYRARAAPARAGLRRNSADCSVTEAAAFLRACGLCRRRLGPGRDTFMYKGEAAFCSLECRQQHMTQEEWKDKCAVKSTPSAAPASPARAAAPWPRHDDDEARTPRKLASYYRNEPAPIQSHHTPSISSSWATSCIQLARH